MAVANDEGGPGSPRAEKMNTANDRQSPTTSVRNKNQLSIPVPGQSSSSSSSTMLLSAGASPGTASASLKSAQPEMVDSIGTSMQSSSSSITSSHNRGLGLSRLSNEDLAALNAQRQRTMQSLEGHSHTVAPHQRVESGLSAAGTAYSSSDDYAYAALRTGTSDPRISLASTSTGQTNCTDETSEDSHAQSTSSVVVVNGKGKGRAVEADEAERASRQDHLSAAGARETFVTNASGALGVYSGNGASTEAVAVEQQQQNKQMPSSSSTSLNKSTNRRSFFSTLLSRSPSFTGQTASSSLTRSASQSSSSLTQQAYPHRSPSSAGGPSSPSRASTSTVPEPASRRRTFSNGHTHARHSSNPIPPSPIMFNPPSPGRRSLAGQSPRLGGLSSSGGRAGISPIPYDGVFGSSNVVTTVSANPFSTTGNNTTPSSRASRILRSHFTSSTSSRNHIPDASDESRRSPITSRMSRTTTSDSLSSLNNNNSPQIQPQASLSTLGLSLYPLSPSLNVGRYGQPLCGAVLDQKYLLIGTSFGLDFLPLHRAGNRSLKSGFLQQFSSSSQDWTTDSNTLGNESVNYGKDARIRKPISLIKKTRFKQLVVLSERSNVLLAVAGRNDHVRVYPLDSLRAVIERKMKEIDEKENSSNSYSSSPFGSSTNGTKGLGVFMNGNSGGGAGKAIPPVPPLPSNLKGKGRAVPSPLLPSPASQSPRAAPTSTTMSTSFSSTSTNLGSEDPELSPPPAYSFPSEASSSSISSTATRRSSASSGGPATPRFAPNQAHRVRSRTSINNLGTSIQPRSVPSSPRASPGLHSPRRRSRETLRRPSSGGATTPGSVSRRGSAATVTPGTLAALAAASNIHGRRRSATSVQSNRISPNSGTRHRSGSSGNLGYTSSSAESSSNSVQAFDEEGEDVEWIDAPESPTTPLISSFRASESSAAFGFPSMASSSPAGNTRMRPRSAVARNEEDSGTDAQAMVSDSSEMARQQQQRANRRLSLADILKESRIGPPSPSLCPEGTGSRSASPTSTTSSRPPQMMMQRSTSAGILSTLSNSNLRNKPQARLPISTLGRDEMASLADFLDAGPPSPKSTVPRSAPMLQRTFTSESSEAAANRPRALRSASSKATLTSTHTNSTVMAGRTRMQPRSPISQKPEEEGEAEDAGPSFMDIMRAGPPGLTDSGFSSSMTQSSSSESSSLQTKSVDMAQPVTSELRQQKSAPSPAMSRSPAMPSIAAASRGGEERISSSAIRERTLSTRSEGAVRNQHGRRVASEILSSPQPIPLGLTKAQKRMSYQPRSPTFQQPSRTDIQAGGANMPRSMSLQEMLTVEPPSPIAAVSERLPSPGLQRTNTQSSNHSTLAAPMEATTPGGRKKKRWSLLDGLRGGSQPTSPNPAASSSSGMVASRSSTSLSSSSRANSPVVDRTSSSSFPSQASSTSIASASSLTQVPEHTVTPMSSNPPVLKPRPGVTLEEDSPPFGNLTPEVEQQALAQANNPEGTTVTFTQTNVTSVGASSSTSAGVGGNSRSSNAGTGGGMSREATYQAMAGNLEYVKLARTKGARFIRASETSKRTYLAVLCGEQGERIELFTGSKNISLSLNRTFVLPETPRTIEFQLQGEDLLDLYLIYDSAIFALEPSTVRVREVGIQRNQRRAARRERERTERETATLDNTIPSVQGRGTPSPQPSSVANGLSTSATSQSAEETSRAPTPLDVESARLLQQDSQDELPPPPLTPLEPNVPVPVPRTSTDTSALVRTTSSSEPAPASSSAMATDSSSDGAGIGGNAAAGTDSTGKTVPYSMFQQLEYLPPVPPSVLSSSYVIPPTYETVLSASPMPAQEAFRALSPDITNGRAASPALAMLSSETFNNTELPLPASISAGGEENGTPLLSPVSLLANPSARNTGPPGLFFVTKGQSTTSIVDGDGRSVIKKPISWTEGDSSSTLAEQALETFNRLDIILTSSKTRVCLAAFGPTSAKIIELGGAYEHSLEVIPPEAYKRRIKSNASIASAASAGKEVHPDETFTRDVTYLAKSGEATYFAEKVGNGVMIHALAAVGFSVPQ